MPMLLVTSRTVKGDALSLDRQNGGGQPLPGAAAARPRVSRQHGWPL